MLSDGFRETAIEGLLLPSLMVIFLAVIALTWGLDRLVAKLGLYDWIWHPSLFRVSLFILLFSGFALVIY